MRRVTITTGSPQAMSAMIPALIDIIHYVAVIASRGVVSQVGGEIGHIKNDATQCQDYHEANYQGIFHLLHLLKTIFALWYQDQTTIVCDFCHIQL